MARPNASRLFAACIATAISSPPVRQTSRLASRPNTSRSAKSHGLCAPCASANRSPVTTAGTTTASHRHRNQLPIHCDSQPRKKYSSPAACSGVVNRITIESAIQPDAGVRGHRPVSSALEPATASSPPAGKPSCVRRMSAPT
jgi:hypothetical protein